MFETRFFDRNGVIGTAATSDGIRQYTVLDTRNQAAMSTTVPSLALRVAREWADAPQTRQIESPLPACERQSSGLAGPSGSAANHMSDPMRAMLGAAAGNIGGRVYRGRLSQGRYPLSMLTAAARRGWLALEGVRYGPRWGQITDAGRRALARELTKVGAA